MTATSTPRASAFNSVSRREFMSLSLTSIGGARALRLLCVALLAVFASALVACGGKADPPLPAGGRGAPPQPLGGVSPPSAVAPALTPVASQTVQSGQTATFSVTA